MVRFWLGPGAGSRSRRPSRTRIADRSGPIVTTSSPPDRSRPPRWPQPVPGGGTGPGGHAAPAARGTGEGCGEGRDPPACAPHRACHEMLRATGRSGSHHAAVRGLRAGWPPRGPAAAGSPAASDAVGGMRYRQQCAPSRHRARTRRSEIRRPDGVCSRSVIGAPPDRSAHSRRRYARRPKRDGAASAACRSGSRRAVGAQTDQGRRRARQDESQLTLSHHNDERVTGCPPAARLMPPRASAAAP